MDTDQHQQGHGCNGGGDVTEWKKVAELRAVVEAQDPAAKVPRHILDLCIHPLVTPSQLISLG